MTERTEHIIRMIIGAVAYLLTVKLVPTWVPGSHGLFMALLPHSGYYAHHLRDLPWHVPVEVTNE